MAKREVGEVVVVVRDKDRTPLISIPALFAFRLNFPRSSFTFPFHHLSHHHHLDLPLLSLFLFDPETATASPSPLLRDVGWPFFVG